MLNAVQLLINSERSVMTMTGLREQLAADMKTAMRSQDKFTLGVLRSVLGEVQTAEKSGKSAQVFTDEQVAAVLRKEVKKRTDTAKIYSDAGHAERAETELNEAKVLSAYLPAELDEDAVVALIDAEVAKLDAPSMRDMGKVMKAVNAEIAGRFDGKRTSELVRARLA